MKMIIILLGKLLIVILRQWGKNGSALPGHIVENIYPSLLHKQLNQLKQGVIIITGTNGKTTTTKSLVHLLEQSGLRVLTNSTGSNLSFGIYSTLLDYSKFFDALDYDMAVFELDEAYSRIFAKQYPPRFVLVLNITRDQLDRYGEIDQTVHMIGQTVSYATEGVILNDNDARTVSLQNKTRQKITFFGMSEHLKNDLPSDDDLYGACLHRIETKSSPIRLHEYKHGNVAFDINHQIYHTPINITGIHNAFNLTAALAAAMRISPKTDPQFFVSMIKDITAAFGRGELIQIGEKKIILELVKNPLSFRQSLQSYDAEKFDCLLFVINDRVADGCDVSWLWDVGFSHIPNHVMKYCGGTRRYEMSLRLKYDELDSTVINNLSDLIKNVTQNTFKKTLIYCTYTAMLDVRKLLSHDAHLREIWS